MNQINQRPLLFQFKRQARLQWCIAICVDVKHIYRSGRKHQSSVRRSRRDVNMNNYIVMM